LAFFIFGACRAQTGLPDDSELAGALSGIVHFTRWPDPKAELRICVDAPDERVAAAIGRILADVSSDRRQIVVVTKALATATVEQLLDCQAIYFGAMQSSGYRVLLMQMVNRPVLTVGQGEEFCSYGGLFCLESVAQGARIRVNLDSIASSGLRVNPQLLRLTQRKGSAK
jgi:hypothetical protein